MKALITRSATILVAMLAIAAPAVFACSMKTPSYTVTQLRGKVVGHFFGTRVQPLAPRWLRHLYSVEGAELTLSEYVPSSPTYTGTEIEKIRADSAGRFAFKTRTPGQYVLLVKAPNLGAFFFITIAANIAPTDLVTIDASPLLSDCGGGDYMVVRSAAKN